METNNNKKRGLPFVFHMKNEDSKDKKIRLFHKDEENVGMHPILEDSVTYKDFIEQLESGHSFEVYSAELYSMARAFQEFPIYMKQGKLQVISIPFWEMRQMNGDHWNILVGYGEDMPIKTVDKNTVWKMILPAYCEYTFRVYPIDKKSNK